MAPISLEPLISQTVQKNIPKEVPICSDPFVVPSSRASERIKKLWWLHGHPHSRRYANPKLVSLAELVRYDGTVYKGQIGFLYPAAASSDTLYESMTWDIFDSVTETIALSYAYQLEGNLLEANRSKKQPTVALLGTGTSLEYFCTQIALQKLGLRVLLLAESNSIDALHFLLNNCNVTAVIVDRKNQNANTNGIVKLKMVETLPEISDLEATEVDAVKFEDDGDVWERHTFIIHSSGSTGMPKPIIHTNRSMMLIARMYRLFQEFEVTNWFLLFPLYHIAGISIALSGLPNGKALSFPPVSWPPSASSIFKAWANLASMGQPVDCVHCAPTLIENMYEYIVENGMDFRPLSALKVLQPGGAVLSNSIIRDLIEHGVNVKTTYGSTEIGPLMRPVPHTRQNEKVYSFRNLYPDSPFLKMEPVEDGVYELVVYKGFELAAELWEGKPENQPYRTNDLFIQDPPGSGTYVMQGRKDDILVHSNGENTSAGSLQLDIQTSSKVIAKALVLGHSLPCPSLLIQIHEHYNPDSVSIQNLVWQSVQKVNTRYPSHSQITRSMIYVLPEGSTLPVTPKGNVKRKEAERIFDREIRQLYETLTSDNGPLSTSQETLFDFLRLSFARLARVPISTVTSATTIYDLGIDSRLILTLRKQLSMHLNISVSISTIYENPSVSQLGSVLQSRQTVPDHPSQIPSSAVVRRLISKLELEFETWPARSTIATYPRTASETILLTGCTGSLGTALLESLYSSLNVQKIYALVRGPSQVARLKSSLLKKGIDPAILKGGKVQVLNFSMQDPLLGLDIDTYQRLAASVTIVIQNAWKMDFNIRVEEFECDCIRSTMSLLRFCHAGRPKSLAFTSSVSTCMGAGQQSSFVDESPIGSDPSVALPTGYAQSKYIIERITQTASNANGLNIPIHLLRVGQLCGSTKTGHWNTDEWGPIMFATSAHPQIRALPVFPLKSVDWTPVDVAAETITQLLVPAELPKHEFKGYEVHNIVNRNVIPWSQLVSTLQSSSLGNLEEVKMAEWVRRLNILADAGSDPREVPGLRLLSFWEDMVGDVEASKIFKTEKAVMKSKAAREVGAFCGEWLESNLATWRESGFLK